MTNVTIIFFAVLGKLFLKGGIMKKKIIVAGHISYDITPIIYNTNSKKIIVTLVIK